VIGESEQEARDKLDTWQELVHPDVGVLRLSQDLETDLSDLPLDEAGAAQPDSGNLQPS